MPYFMFLNGSQCFVFFTPFLMDLNIVSIYSLHFSALWLYSVSVQHRQLNIISRMVSGH